jgi:hypothetical protein
VRFIEAVNEAIDMLEDALHEKRQDFQDERDEQKREQLEVRIDRLQETITGLHK